MNGAIKLLTNHMSWRVIPFNDETLIMFQQKHPEEREVREDLIGPLQTVNPISYEVIDDAMVMKAAQKKKGGYGPSELDVNCWRKPLTSRVYGDDGRDLHKAIANVTKKICKKEINDSSLEGFLACRLVPLDKKPGLRPMELVKF